MGYRGGGTEVGYRGGGIARMPTLNVTVERTSLECPLLPESHSLDDSVHVLCQSLCTAVAGETDTRRR